MEPNHLHGALAHLLSGSAGEGVVAAYLHGSHAAGRPHRESDVDLGVVLEYAEYPTSRDRFEAGLRLRSALQPALGGVPLDLVVLNDAPPGLAATVVTRGRRVYCADAEADHAFRRDSQLRAADLAPFLRRTATLKREAIRR
jgi:predicted nucleotidyltransferase